MLSILGIFTGVSTGEDPCSFRLFRDVDSIVFSVVFRLGVVKSPIFGLDFLLLMGIFFRDFDLDDP